jgi:hypothetical protein
LITTSGESNQDRRQKFLSLYPNRAGWISKFALETTPSVPRWLSDGMILRAVSTDIEITYGAKAGRTSKFAVLDINAGSPYHSAGCCHADRSADVTTKFFVVSQCRRYKQNGAVFFSLNERLFLTISSIHPL